MRAWLLSLMLLACDEIEEVDHFSFRITSGAIVSSGTGTPLLKLPDLPGLTATDLALNPAFTERGHDADDGIQLRLAQLDVAVVDPPGQDLGFLNEVRFYAEAPGLSRRLIAQARFAPGTRRVTTTPTPDDLALWLIGIEGSVTTEILGGQRPPEATHLEVQLHFEVDVQVL